MSGEPGGRGGGAAIPGVRVWPLARGPALRIEIDAAGAPRQSAEHAARIDAAWAALRLGNPRLFDGPILSVVSFDAAAARVTCRRESYKWLAVQDWVPTGVHQLGVTGAIVGRDPRDRPHVLLGRRSMQTRTHGGMWELAPSGGLDPPAGGAECTMGRAEVLGALAAESEEELGFSLDWSAAELVALYRDDVAHNDDVVARLDLTEPIDPERRPGAGAARAWEYTRTRWLAIDQAAGFDAAEGAGIRPPTRALLRFFGWV